MKKLLSIYCLLGIELLSAEPQKETKIILNKKFSEIASANDEKSVAEIQKIIKLWYGENAVLQRNENGYVIVLKEQSEEYPGETMSNPFKFGLHIDGVAFVSLDCDEFLGNKSTTCQLLSELWRVVRKNEENNNAAHPEKFAKKYLK